MADSKAGAPFAPSFSQNGKRRALSQRCFSCGGACVSVSVPILLLLLANWVSPWLRLILETMMCYQLMATKCLKDESMKFYHKLAKGDIPGARHMLSMIVGRDTERLQADGIARAAVETVAENTSDGVIAPLLFMTVGGAPLGFFYKAVNTMDSMVGYKNEKYLYLGRCAARLDDLLNFVPARLSAWLMILSARMNGMDARNAGRIYRRDRRNHESPNSAHTEAVCAGALRVQLAGMLGILACYTIKNHWGCVEADRHGILSVPTN
ncbi:MAG: adenosylcobinamide-phosphate synthase CbiB [[Clostridium] leptum]